MGAECNAIGVCVENCNDTCLSQDAQCGTICGVDCGSCALGQGCKAYQCVCEPNCDGKVCGDDGCGGTCGDCPDNGACDAAGQCSGCVPDCDGKECGSDGCEGICGPGCGLSEVCDEEIGICISSSCCYTNDAPGCNISDVEDCVCATNPNCCAAEGSWDSFCVLAATLICGAQCGTEEEATACEGFCGAQSPTGCFCDSLCTTTGDCCEDACDTCGFCEEEEPLSESCEGVCGGTAPSGCSCEAGCADAGTCCEDACSVCGECEEVVVIPNSCENQCGIPFNAAADCQCNPGCVENGDCCENACDLCGFCEEAPAELTCENQCGADVTVGEVTCSCASDCLIAGTCCPDAADFCTLDAADSCEGFCGTKAPDGCYCDDFCVNLGDCCDDACSVCGECVEEELSESCEGACDGLAPSGCSCEADCYASGTCCSDIESVCGYADNTDSCEGVCDGIAPSGCSCSQDCYLTDTCCPDVLEACDYGNNSCAGNCDGEAESGCYCDDFCVANDDCCEDACALCGTCDEETDFCALEDACSEGDVDVTECGFCGYQTRTCDSSCLWGAWSGCIGAGECSAGSQEACDSGCGVKTCLNSCSYGSCSYSYDDYEYNNTKSLAFKFQEEPLPEGTVLTTTADATLHSDTDVDWYSIDLVESGGTDWTFNIDASLIGGESGLREICLFYDRKSDGTTDYSECTSGSGNVLNADLGDIDSFASNDDGTLYIRVEGQDGCTPYQIKLTVD